MKKLFFFLAAVAVAMTANAKVTTISPDADNDALRLAVHYAEDGDIIEMTEGTYVQCNNNYVEFDGKSVTVKAAEGANVVLQLQVPITLANGGKATLQGIKIDASRLNDLADWYEHVIYPTDATEGKQLVMDGCELYGFNINKSAIYSSSSNTLALCDVKNCYFYNNDKSCLFFEGESLGQLSVTNSTFANITAKVTDSYYAGIIDVRNAAAKVTVDHCTFYNCLLMNTDYAAVMMKGPQAANVVISNNIFMLPEAIDGHRAIRENVEATNCMTFNYVKDNGGIHSSVTKTNCFLNVDPLFVDAANGNFALAEGSPALGAGTDGSNLGDPRWNAPAVEEYVIELAATKEVSERMGRIAVTFLATDETHGEISLNISNYIEGQDSYDVSGTIGEVYVDGTATLTIDATKEVLVAEVAAEDGSAVYDVTLTYTYPLTKEYTFLAMDDAEATVEDWGEEGDPFLVYIIAGAGTLDGEPVEFELMVDVTLYLEGVINGVFVMGEATQLYDEEGSLYVEGTAMDEAGNTYNIEVYVPLSAGGGEQEITIVAEFDVTLYNLNLEVMGNMAMVTAGGDAVSFGLANLTPMENYYGFYTSDSFSNIWFGEQQLLPYGDGQYTPDGFTVAFISTPDDAGNAVMYNFTLKAGDDPSATALDNINTTVAPVKAIVNGQLVILKDGVKYNAQGAVL